MCESDDGEAAMFRVSMADSDSASNLAEMCAPCTVLWLASLTPGEQWLIKRVAP